MKLELRQRLDALSEADLILAGYTRLNPPCEPPPVSRPPVLEVEAAAKFWADQLARPQVQDNGDVMQTVLGTLVAEKNYTHLRDEQIQLFMRWLGWLIQKRWSNTNTWNSAANPLWGQRS